MSVLQRFYLQQVRNASQAAIDVRYVEIVARLVDVERTGEELDALYPSVIEGGI